MPIPVAVAIVLPQILRQAAIIGAAYGVPTAIRDYRTHQNMERLLTDILGSLPGGEPLGAMSFIRDQILSLSPEDLLDLSKSLMDFLRPLDDLMNSIPHKNVTEDYNRAKNWRPRRDPLAIDLDGDGIETVSAEFGIRFDHDGDGIKFGSGWVAGDDGLLVLDRNANGLIDSGAELFGIDTVLGNGQKATDGFQALAELDSNSDGVIDAGDAAFQDLKVWRDVNQDGVSQASELFSLAEIGIRSFNLTKTVVTENLGDGNQVLATGVYTRDDGSMASFVNLDLEEDRFNSEFVESIAVSAEVLALPQMRGMGLVRNLSEAAMLSPTVFEELIQYAAATTF